MTETAKEHVRVFAPWAINDGICFVADEGEWELRKWKKQNCVLIDPDVFKDWTRYSSFMVGPFASGLDRCDR